MKNSVFFQVCLISVLISGSAFSQLNALWGGQYQHTTTPGYSNEGRYIGVDPNGFIFVLSDVTSDIDPFGIQGTGTYHYVNLTKYNDTGLVVASLNLDIQGHIVSGPNNYSAFGLIVDNTGEVYIGFSYLHPINGFNVTLAKYHNDLSRDWLCEYETIGADVGIDMKLHPNGKLYAVVKSTDLTTTYSIISSEPNSTSCNLIYSYSPNGVAINSIALDGAQKAYVAGYGMKGAYKYLYVGEINISTNTLVWSSQYSPPGIAGDDYANQITVGVDGNIYTVGTTYMGSVLYDQAVVLKNQPGNPRFDFIAILGETDINERGIKIDASESGWVYAGFAGDSTVGAFRIPDDGLFVTPGKVEFRPTPGNAYNAITGASLSDMVISSAKNIYLSGSLTATNASGNFSCSFMYKASVVFGNALIPVDQIAPDGDFDRNYEGLDLSLDYSKADVYWLRNYWDDSRDVEIVELLDIDAPTPLRKRNPAQASGQWNVRLLPNPANDMVRFESSSMIEKIEVYDAAGKLILRNMEVNSKSVVLNTSEVSPGIYFCRISSGTSASIEKLVIE